MSAADQQERERMYTDMREQCLELKRTANSLSEENVKLRTREMVLKRELQRRDRLLRQLALLKQAGQGIDMEMIEKLREERNLLPIVRQKAHDLQSQLASKEAEIRKLKRDPHFTRILELQVEFATWQHEAKRLDSLLLEPSAERNEDARKEVEAHEGRATRLLAALDDAKKAQAKAESELQEEEDSHREVFEQYREKERELEEQQRETRELATAYQQLLQERKQADQLQAKIDEMRQQERQYEEERAVAEQAAAEAAAREAVGRRNFVSQAALSGPPLPSDEAAADLLRGLRRATIARLPSSSSSSGGGSGSLFAALQRCDRDADGLLSAEELSEAAASVGYSLPVAEATSLIQHLPLEVTPAESAIRRIRWLDLLVILDRLGAARPVSQAVLPDVQPLRAACLRSNVDADQLRKGVAGTATSAQARQFFGGTLGLEAGTLAQWVEAWQTLGSDGLLLRLPLGEVVRPRDSLEAWRSRCTAALRARQRSLQEVIEDSQRLVAELAPSHFTRERLRDMLLEPEVLGRELSEDDIEDLTFYASQGSTVDPGVLLRFDGMAAASG